MGEASVDYSKLQYELETSVTFPKEIEIPLEIGQPVAVASSAPACRFSDIPLVEPSSPESVFTTSDFFAISFELGPYEVEVVEDSYCYGQDNVPSNGHVAALFQLASSPEPEEPYSATSSVPSNAHVAALFQLASSPEPEVPYSATSSVPSNGHAAALFQLMIPTEPETPPTSTSSVPSNGTVT